jgi:hypothetical protein
LNLFRTSRVVEPSADFLMVCFFFGLQECSVQVACRPSLLRESTLDQAHAIQRCALSVGGLWGRQRTRNVGVDITIACVAKRGRSRLVEQALSVCCLHVILASMHHAVLPVNLVGLRGFSGFSSSSL